MSKKCYHYLAVGFSILFFLYSTLRLQENYDAITEFSFNGNKTNDLMIIFIGLLGIVFSMICHDYYEGHKNILFSSTPKVWREDMKKFDYNSEQGLSELYDFLVDNNTFYFPVLDNGLFPAANLLNESEYTGYSYVWVRDNIHIAHAHYINNKVDISKKTVETLSKYFFKYKYRFERIILGIADHNNAMVRPNIRFDGKALSEIEQKWSHAQNDALGYFLWLFCKFVNEKEQEKKLKPTDENIYLVALFILYFEKIKYWQDDDNGHWEEARKVEASSIGVVLAALKELKEAVNKKNIIFKKILVQYEKKAIDNDLLEELINKGTNALVEILPNECIQSDKYRNYDASLLFLIYPLNVIKTIDFKIENMEDIILKNVIENLQGEYGIRRYLGDSYWAADYKELLEPEKRTIDVSDNMSDRDKFLKPGQEAQWCIFDPIISIIYGNRYINSDPTASPEKEAEYKDKQFKYFNRSLSQMTSELDERFGGYRCPELYYLEKGRYVPNDTTPLLWTQANLWIAFKFMKDSYKKINH